MRIDVNVPINCLLSEHGEKRNFVVDTSFTDLAGDESIDHGTRVDWKNNLISLFRGKLNSGKEIVAISEVIAELNMELTKVNDLVEVYRRNGEDSIELRTYSNKVFKVLRMLRGKDIRQSFDSVETSDYNKFYKFAQDLHWETLDLQDTYFYKENSFGGKLNTDRKVIASAFALGRKDPTIILTRDVGIEKLVSDMKGRIFSSLARKEYNLPYVDLDNVQTFNPDRSLYLSSVN